MQSNIQKNFAEIPSSKLPRAKFNRSFDVKTTFDAGYLIPVMVDEVLPGDRMKLDASAVVRLATPIYPIMDNLALDIHFFSVPCRLLWDNWRQFMGQRDDPADTIDALRMPTLIRTAATDFTTGTIFDYMGLPPNVDTSVEPTSLPFRAYNLIWNEWYRDQNLQDRVTVSTADADDTPGDFALLRRNKRHDYFTSCLPWPQRTSAVEIPLGTSAPVTGLGFSNQTFTFSSQAAYETDGSGTVTYANLKQLNTAGTNERMIAEEDPSNSGYPNIRADLSAATGISVNDLRDYITLQQFAELDARGGTRYTEIIKAHFNVSSSDARLQRPELLGRVTHHVGIQPVQTTGGNDTNARAVGDLGATAYSAFGDEHCFTYSAEEHCYIIGLASVRSDLTYSQGVDRMWTRATREDFYWPTFANLGEQPVYQYELQAESGGVSASTVFGYQERYAEYRSKRSQLSGLMRVDAAGTLSAWHLSQDLPNTTALNTTFIEENPPIDRVVSVPSEPDFIANFYFDYECERQMPLYGVPGIARL